MHGRNDGLLCGSCAMAADLLRAYPQLSLSAILHASMYVRAHTAVRQSVRRATGRPGPKRAPPSLTGLACRTSALAEGSPTFRCSCRSLGCRPSSSWPSMQFSNSRLPSQGREAPPCSTGRCAQCATSAGDHASGARASTATHAASSCALAQAQLSSNARGARARRTCLQACQCVCGATASQGGQARDAAARTFGKPP